MGDAVTVIERVPVVAVAHIARVCHLLDEQYRTLCHARIPRLDVHYTDPSGPLCDGCGQRLCERCVELNETLGDAA